MEGGYPWDAYTCRAAAVSGHLEVLQYAREGGCPWAARTAEEYVVYFAVVPRRVRPLGEVLKYMHTREDVLGIHVFAGLPRRQATLRFSGAHAVKDVLGMGILAWLLLL